MSRLLVNHRAGPFVVRKDAVDGDAIYICGCGLTGAPPFCDGSHATARKELPGSLVHYPDNDDANAPVPVDPALLPGAIKGAVPGASPARDAT